MAIPKRLTVLAMALATLVATIMYPAAPAHANSSDKLLVVLTGDQGLSDAITGLPQATRPVARRVLDQLAATLDRGTSANVPSKSGGATLEAQREEIRKAEAALTGTAPVSSSFWSGRWDIRGASCGTGCWKASFKIEGYTCGSTCELTDKAAGYATANYGGVTSAIYQNVLYFPNSGGFHKIHYQLWPGTELGFNSLDSQDGPESEGNISTTSYVTFPAKGHWLAFNIALWLDAPGFNPAHPGHHAGYQWMSCSADPNNNTCS